MRLEGYDYSRNGAYFVTICTLGRVPLFDHAPAVEMVAEYWEKIPSKFPTVALDEYVIMSNHMHGILVLNVGFDPCVEPSLKGVEPSHVCDDQPGIAGTRDAVMNVGSDPCVGPSFNVATKHSSAIENSTNGNSVAPTLPRIIQWFKTLTTNAYIRGVKNENWPPFVGKLWQHSYHERIIRKNGEIDTFREYIRMNPERWDEDPENIKEKVSNRKK